MEPSKILEKIVLQITNGGAECEIYLVAGTARHRVSTGPLAPLLDQLDAVREQYSSDASEIVLQPHASTDDVGPSPSGGWKVFKRSKSKGKKGKRASTGGEEPPAWFTRETAEKAFHLLSSLELLELPARLARDLEKVHEKEKVAQPYQRASLETSRMTLQREFAKAMLVANCAGYKAEDMGPVKSFAEAFKGRRLGVACQAFETACSAALSRLPPQAAKQVAAPPASWPANQIPVIEADAFDDDSEAPAEPQQSVGEVQTPTKVETREAGTDAETAVDSGVATEGQQGAADDLVDRVGGTSKEKKGELGAGKPAAAVASNGYHGVEGKMPKAEGAALAKAVENAKEAPAEVEQKTPDAKEAPQPSSAAGLTSNAPASKRPQEVLSAPDPDTPEKGSASDGPDQALPAQETPAKDGPAKAPLAAAKDEFPAPESQPTELRQNEVPSEAPGSVAVDAGLREIEPTPDPSSPVLRGKPAHTGSPLSWSDEDEMKLARHSYGSQGLAGIGAAPLHSAEEPGAFESEDLPLSAAAGSQPVDSPSGAEGPGGVGRAGEVVKERHSDEAAEPETADEGKGQPAELAKEPVGAGQVDDEGTVPKGRAKGEPGSEAAAGVAPVKVGTSPAPKDIDELWRITKERLFTLPPRENIVEHGVAAKERDQEVACDVAEAGSSEHTRKGAVSETGASRGSEAASNVSVAGSSRELTKIGSDSGMQGVAVSALAGKAPSEETVAAGYGSRLAATAGVLSATALAAEGQRLSQPHEPREEGTGHTGTPVDAEIAPRGASTAVPEGTNGPKGESAPKDDATVPDTAPPVLIKESGAPASEGVETSLAQAVASLPFKELPKGGEAQLDDGRRSVPGASTDTLRASEDPSDTGPIPVLEQGSEPKQLGNDSGEVVEKENTTEEAFETHSDSLQSAAPAALSPHPPILPKARSYDKPWLSHSVLPASRSPNEGAPAGEAHGPSKADAGAKDTEQRASEGRARRDSMASYKERRQAKMKEQEERIRGEHEAKLKALEDALEKRKAEMAERSRRSALLSATAADRRAAMDGTTAAPAAPEDTTEEAKERARERLRKYREDKGLASAEASPPVGSRVNQLLAKLGVMVGNSPTGQSKTGPSAAQKLPDGKKSVDGTRGSSMERSQEGRSPSMPKPRGQQSPRGTSPGARNEGASSRSTSAPRRRSSSGPPDGTTGGQTAADILSRSISPGRASIVRSPQASSRGPSPARAAASVLGPGQASPGRASLANTPKSAASPYPSPRGPLSGRTSPKPGGWNKPANTPPAKVSTAAAQTTPRAWNRATSAPQVGGPPSQRKAPPQAPSPGTFGRTSRSTSSGTFGTGPRSSSFGAAPRLSSPGTFGRASRPASAGAVKSSPAAPKFVRPTSASAVERKVEVLPEDSTTDGGRIGAKNGSSARGVFQPRGPSSGSPSTSRPQDGTKPAWSSGLRVTVTDSNPRPRDRFGNRTALPPTPHRPEPRRSLSAAGPPRRTSLPGSTRSASTTGIKPAPAKAAEGFKRAFGPGGSNPSTPSSQPANRLRRGRHSIAAVPSAPSPVATPRRSSGGFGASNTAREPVKVPANPGTPGSAPRTSSYLMSAKDRLLSQTKASQAKLAERTTAAVQDPPSKRRERKSVAGTGQAALGERSTPVVRPARRASAGEAYPQVETDVDNASVETVRSTGSVAGGSFPASPLVHQKAPGEILETPVAPQASEIAVERSMEDAGVEMRRLKGGALERSLDSVEQLFGEEIVLGEEDGTEDERNKAEAFARQQKLLGLLQARQQSPLTDNLGDIRTEQNSVERNGNGRLGDARHGQMAESTESMFGTKGEGGGSDVEFGASPPTKIRKRWEEPVEPLVMQKSPGDSGGTLGKLGKLFSRKSSKGAEGDASPLK
ncbi:hypothetical protein KFL_000130015 [Klebsormidium nitens]|uniref:Uncharacterized protein n=1 Tax=Klebsormidium nitens TaxID=105231 RepID=A0A1Y1HMJ9_KLENI|nr:hypothetical protein KFL_000130015 [Klebsormidium nitens]|eukprot:GAQ78419.1 hypothetical protein KFL_000130015 [Klebsormidium nitens]